MRKNTLKSEESLKQPNLQNSLGILRFLIDPDSFGSNDRKISWGEKGNSMCAVGRHASGWDGRVLKPDGVSSLPRPLPLRMVSFPQMSFSLRPRAWLLEVSRLLSFQLITRKKISLILPL